MFTLGGVLFASFVIFRSIPGDPASNLTGERASKELKDYYRSKLRLNESTAKQFFSYASLLVKGDMGISYFSGRPVFGLLMEKFPNTLRLALWAVGLSCLFAASAGVSAAFSRSPLVKKILGTVFLLGISMPTFWLAIVLILIMISLLKIIPGVGMGNGSFAYIVLPACTLGFKSSLYCGSILRSSIEKIRNSRFITALRSRGVKRRRLALHIFLNSALPFITAAALDLGSYMSGAVLTETIFAWDGIGRLAMDAILKRDYPVILGIIVLSSTIFLLVNCVVDIAYGVLDPRLRERTA